MAAIHHLGFLKTGICDCAYDSEGHFASLCKILCWSVKPLLRYCDFSIFFKWGRPPSWICYVHVWTTHDKYLVHLSLCKIRFQRLRFVSRFWRYIIFYVRIGLWCSSFDNMQVFIFNVFGLKMPIYARNGDYWGFCPLNRQQSHRDPQKASPCTQGHHTMYRSLRSVHPLLHSSPFYQIPWNPMLCIGLDTPLKVPLPLGHLHLNLIHGFLGTRDSASKTASRSV